MVLRYLVSAVTALVVTLALFALMDRLIAARGSQTQRVASVTRVDLVRVKRESEVQTRKRALPEKVKPQRAPTAPPAPTLATPTRMPSQALPVAAPIAGPRVALAGTPTLGAAPADTEIVPLVRIAPQYPSGALARGIEGWVEVQFTVDPDGQVVDPVVVARSSGSSVFDREALRAIKKWKYKPRIENGVAVERRGLVVRLTFELTEQ